MDSRPVVAAPPHGVRIRALPRLSRRAGFWAVAFSFLTAAAFSTAPSSLYGLWAHEQHLAPFTLTIIYAVYAAGLVASLLLAGHVSDWYGRRTVLIPALVLALVATGVFLLWRSLAGLLVARVLTGLATGAVVATATAYIADLDGRPGDPPTRRAGVVATIANIGGLGLGPLVAGLLAAYAGHPLTLTFVVFATALLVALALVLIVPEGHAPVVPRPRYRPQRLLTPERERRQFVAAITGGFLAFAVGGLFAGLAGRLLAGPLHHPSPALTGLTIFLAFGAGALVQTLTTTWPTHRLMAAGVPPLVLGLGLLVGSQWLSPPSLTLFLVAVLVAGAGSGAIIRGSLTVVIASTGPDDRAGALATYFAAGYTGVALPVVGLGIALEYLSPRVTLLIFGVLIGLGVLAAAPLLMRRPAGDADAPTADASDALSTMCHGFGALPR